MAAAVAKRKATLAAKKAAAQLVTEPADGEEGTATNAPVESPVPSPGPLP
jgi:hypothetical protein